MAFAMRTTRARTTTKGKERSTAGFHADPIAPWVIPLDDTEFFVKLPIAATGVPATKEICRDFLNRRCFRGPKCRWMHPEVCRLYLEGRCKFGRCPRIHPPLNELQSPPPLNMQASESFAVKTPTPVPSPLSTIVKLPPLAPVRDTILNVRSKSISQVQIHSNSGHAKHKPGVSFNYSALTWDPGTNYDAWADTSSSSSGDSRANNSSFSGICSSNTSLASNDENVVAKTNNWGPDNSTADDSFRWTHTSDLIRPLSTHKVPLKGPIISWSYTLFGHIKVKFGEGFEILDILTAFDTPWIQLEHLPFSVTLDDISSMLQPWGEVVDIRIPEKKSSGSKEATTHLPVSGIRKNDTSSALSKHERKELQKSAELQKLLLSDRTQTVRARFATAADALKAISGLNHASIHGKTITARLPLTSQTRDRVIFRDTAVRVEWPSPNRTAFAGYDNKSDALAAVLIANRYGLEDTPIEASMYEGLPAVDAFTVKFCGLPVDATDKDLAAFCHPSDVLWVEPNYTSIDFAVAHIRRKLTNSGGLVTFDVPPPPYRDLKVIAWANFASPADAKKACRTLNGRLPLAIGRIRLWAQHIHSIQYSLSRQSYDRAANDIDQLRIIAYDRARGASITILDYRKDRPQPVLVRLFAESMQELGQLKSEFEKVTYGEIIREDDGKVAWDDFFGRPEGLDYLANVRKTQAATSITADIPRRTITVCGVSSQRSRIRNILLARFRYLREQKEYAVRLPGHLIGEFINSQLPALNRQMGPERIRIDLWNHKLFIRGDRADLEVAHLAVDNTQSLQSHYRQSETVCPVCFSVPPRPIELVCGHQWCRACIERYLCAAVDTRSFPLTCLGNDATCSEPISLSVARKVLTSSQFDAVMHAAFFTFIHSRPNEFHHCPTRDCPQVYRSAPSDTTTLILQCPECLVRICPYCHVEYHDGFTCSENISGGDRLFNKWAKENNVKKCPGCNIPIERSEGCAHLTCLMCKTHTCWKCMATFPKGDGIYDHMRIMHGNIGLDDHR